MLATPSRIRQTKISFALPKLSAMTPSAGCTSAKVTANADASVATTWIVTAKSAATCGSTGSIDRPDSEPAKQDMAMIASR